jgi:esterase/lipase superfamily enzyme
MAGHRLKMEQIRNTGVGFLFLIILLTGCQPKVYLMPPPISLKPDTDFFNMSEDSKDENLLYTLYATNRLPFDRESGSIGYTIFPSNTLALGLVVHSVGEQGTSWEELYKQSLETERDKKLLIHQEYARSMTSYDLKDDLKSTTEKADGYFDQINQALKSSFDKDILVYVHGANSNFYRATAQGAQYRHFTGHNTIVLTFSWPSAESLLKYKTDVLHAKKTIPAFARLLELLAQHTNARNINILAYSAGAQVVAPGLAYIRDKYPEIPSEDLKKKFRIGEVYFAAPDAEFKTFIARYLKFKDFIYRTTINFNTNDSVLRISAMQNGVSRLGRPDVSELSEEGRLALLEAMRNSKIDFINMSESEALNLGRSHGSWYNHPWVSSDLLLLFLCNADPEERGLEKYVTEEQDIGYIFPPDYDTAVRERLEENAEFFLNKMKSKWDYSKN